MLYGHWLSFQVHLALEGNGANDMLRPGSLSSFSGATFARCRVAWVALYCLALPCGDKRGSPTPLMPPIRVVIIIAVKQVHA